MTAGSQRAALDAVHSARPIVARLSTTRDKEDLAADLIEAWGAVENGLRSLVGGTTLGGQMLIRELRQRHFLSLEQANALAEFHAAAERAGRTDYAPTEGDVNAAREAFLKLESGLMGETTAPAPRPSAPVPHMETPLEPSYVSPALVAGPGSRPAWVTPVIGAVVLLLVVGLGWWALAGRGGSAAYDQGVLAYKEGRREAAEGSFHKASTDNPSDPMPHVYLARMEREKGNLQNANAEAVKAVQLGPANGAALRELASTLYQQQNFDGARSFYIRAIRADSTDRLSQGYLGCSLVRLGRVQEGAKWIGRAGTGSWQSCAPVNGVVPPGMQPAAQGVQPGAVTQPVPMTGAPRP